MAPLNKVIIIYCKVLCEFDFCQEALKVFPEKCIFSTFDILLFSDMTKHTFFFVLVPTVSHAFSSLGHYNVTVMVDTVYGRKEDVKEVCVQDIIKG